MFVSRIHCVSIIFELEYDDEIAVPKAVINYLWSDHDDLAISPFR